MVFVRCIVAVLSGVAGLLATSAEAAPGDRVDNTARVSYVMNGVTNTTDAGPASFVIEAPRTPAEIAFFRISPSAPDGLVVALNGSDYQTSAAGPTFAPVGLVTTTSGSPIIPGMTTRIIPARMFFIGEPVVIRVIDRGQNRDPTVVETVVVTLTSQIGDQITLRLYESGPDTGEFFGFVQSVAGPANPADAVIALASRGEISAVYVNPLDATEISRAAAGVDPFGRLFDSVTGALLDGVSVTIVDDASGQPAPVFGMDGVSSYPSTLTTGSTVVDGAGFVYALGPGEFRFPIMFPGRYRIVLTPPPGFTAPSTADPASLQGLANAPFEIVPASFGGAFDIDGSGDVSFDIPLDPSTEFLLSKTALSPSAAIGDFVRYEIEAVNRGANAARIILSDRLPAGFRYRRGSLRVNADAGADPAIAPDGVSLTIDAGILAPGASARIGYVAEVGPDARLGPAVNTAIARDGAGAALSNRAEAVVEVRDDFLRTSVTVVGRVAADACLPAADRPRAIEKGEGVGGVRLYLETGAHATTDDDGLYSFVNLSARTHVVQVDETTIPEGYELVRCEENTRFAGAAHSQFVDARGGSVWRANFYLRRTGAAPTPKTSADAPAPARPSGPPGAAPASAGGEHLHYDKAWLDAAPQGVDWAYPEPGATPSTRSVNIGLRHDAHLRVRLELNGAPVAAGNFAGRDVSTDRKRAISRWRGVDLLEGDNEFVAVLSDLAGNEVSRLSRRIAFVARIERAQFVPEASRLLADGRDEPLIALRLTDAAGRPVHAGRLVSVDIDPPYRAADLNRIADALPIDTGPSVRTATPVGPDGVALVRLAPTVETGLARIRIRLDSGVEQEIAAYLRPTLRDWIVVGVAEGGLAFEKGAGGAAAVDARRLLRKGRIAAFAKGAVKGGWLVTLAGDSDKRRGAVDEQITDAIDPDDRFAILGDRSVQEFEAQSRYPVYLKAEKEAFQAVVGDFDTGLGDSKLSRYQRRVTGGRAGYEGQRLRFTAFASDTNQSFGLAELAADGTSGPYRIAGAPLVRFSEAVSIETRNRFRPDEIVATLPLARYADYDIDYQTGDLIFRMPIAATDADFNLNVIVVTFETAEATQRNVTAGGRAALRSADGRIEAGATIIHEGAGQAPDGGPAGLAGIDISVGLGEEMRLRAEYAASRKEASDGARTTDDALLLEVEHASARVNARAYFSDVGSDFGLGQQTSAVAGARRYGAEGSVLVDTVTNKDATRRGERRVEFRAYNEQQLTTGAKRLLVEAGLRHSDPRTTAAAGVRWVRDDPASGERRESLLATSSLSHRFEALGLTLRGARDQPVAGNNGSAAFPQRTALGFDQELFDKVTVSVTHEILQGDNARSANTIVGVVAQPWTGARVSASADRLTQDSGERIGATFGVDQQVRLSDRWSSSFGITRRQDLRQDGTVDPLTDIVSDAPLSPLEIDGSYTSLYAGLALRQEKTAGSGRLELRKSAEGSRYTGVLGAAREVTKAFSLAGASRYQHEEFSTAPDRRSAEVRLGAAWRPRDSDGLIVLDRLDVRYDEDDALGRQARLVNNLAVNLMLARRLQASITHGLKYAALVDGDLELARFTQLGGAEARFDLTNWLDVGFHGHVLHAHGSGAFSYAYGPSVGVSPAENLWLTLGWNVEGFEDRDFAAAEWTNAGPYVRLRLKFDQNTAKGLLAAISPDRSR